MKTIEPSDNIDEFDIYAPDLIEQSETFVVDAHSKLREYEDKYFWFSERKHLIHYIIKHIFSGINSYCEIGCGGGYLLSGINNVIHDAKIYGTEIFISGLKIAKNRCPEVNYFQSDIMNFPYTNEFDLIGIYDVIEHLDHDEKAIKSIYDAITVGGGAIITVPQHQWLWTANDVYSCHKRRYSKKELIAKCKHAGFEIIRTTSYTSLLLPAFIVNCIFNRRKDINKESVDKQFEINPALNILFKIICKVELVLIRIGVDFPWGGSLVCVLRKTK